MKKLNLKISILLSILVVFTSCKVQVKNGLLDLSHKGLDSIPNLSKNIEITELNLSHNNISYWDEKKLPPNVRKINISHNKLKGRVDVRLDQQALAKSIDLSYNDIQSFSATSSSLDTILINNNKLKIVFIKRRTKDFSKNPVEYVDISWNTELSNALDFMPTSVKMIKRVGTIGENEELRFKPIKRNEEKIRTN